MKKYVVTCTEITGVAGKSLTSGNAYTEDEFAPGVIADFVESGHLKEYEEPKKMRTITITKDDIAANPDKDWKEGEQIEIEA